MEWTRQELGDDFYVYRLANGPFEAIVKVGPNHFPHVAILFQGRVVEDRVLKEPGWDEPAWAVALATNYVASFVREAKRSEG